jgi:hypothetical protein
VAAARKQGNHIVQAAPRGGIIDERRVLELRIRPELRGSIELRLFIDALLRAAEEEQQRGDGVLADGDGPSSDAPVGGSGEAA